MDNTSPVSSPPNSSLFWGASCCWASCGATAENRAVEEGNNRVAEDVGGKIMFPPCGVTNAVDNLISLDIRREEARVEAAGRNFMVVAVE